MSTTAISNNASAAKNTKSARYRDVANLLTKKDQLFHISCTLSCIYAKRYVKLLLEN
jgi:hypothetical protein